MADALDDDFRACLDVVKQLATKLKTPGEKSICAKWITKIASLRSPDMLVKRNRNSFLHYFVQVLEEAVSINSQDQFSQNKMGGGFEIKNRGEYMSRWSTDKRTYIAAKPIPGRGALVYMAVSKEPSLGWDHSMPKRERK